MAFHLAIDGPAGAGKSTIAKQLAKKMDILYVDTGAMYRAVALYFLEHDLDVDQADNIDIACKEVDIALTHERDGQHVHLNGRDVNGLIRTQAVSDMTSRVSVHPKLREMVVAQQQKIAEGMDLIMDGRDIGTCVLPKAALKIYLTADPMVRAKRRYEELIAKGETAELMTIHDEIVERDYRDMHRPVSPLCQAEDAVLVDTSYMGIDEVVETIYRLAVSRRQEA